MCSHEKLVGQLTWGKHHIHPCSSLPSGILLYLVLHAHRSLKKGCSSTTRLIWRFCRLSCCPKTTEAVKHLQPVVPRDLYISVLVIFTTFHKFLFLS